MQRKQLSSVLTSVAVGVALIALTPTLAAAAPKKADTETLKVFDHNLDKSEKAFNAAIDRATERGADAITLQEVCESWAKKLQDDHKGWTVVYDESKNGADADCDVPADSSGNVAIWTGGGNGKPVHEPLTKDGGEEITNEDGTKETLHKRTPDLTCVRFGTEPVKTVCSTHLVAFDESNVRGKQTNDIRRITKAWIENGQSVVVGGDFNTKPKLEPMNHMYDLKGDGWFNEADQLQGGQGRNGVDTTEKRGKIDYVFFSQNRTPKTANGSLVVLHGQGSGHNALFASAPIQKKG